MAEDYRKIQLIMDLRTQGVRNTRVLDALERIPRERFVAERFAADAYADRALPLPCGQALARPFVIGFMADRLKVTERMKVLEIGTGSGYQTAVMSLLCRRVYSIEHHRPLMKQAESRFQALGLHNITTMIGDGLKGWPAQAPFERILMTVPARDVPEALIDQLAVGGIMILPVEMAPGRQELKRITRTEAGTDIESLLPVSVPADGSADQEP